MSRRSTTTSTLRTAATKDPAADASMRILSGHRRAAAAPSNLPPRGAASQGDSSLDRPAGCQPGRADSTEHPPPTARKAPPRGASPTPPSREQQRACTSIGFALGNDDTEQAAGPPVARASAWRQKQAPARGERRCRDGRGSGARFESAEFRREGERPGHARARAGALPRCVATCDGLRPWPYCCGTAARVRHALDGARGGRARLTCEAS
jgi:hypothetical protein